MSIRDKWEVDESLVRCDDSRENEKQALANISKAVALLDGAIKRLTEARLRDFARDLQSARMKVVDVEVELAHKLR